ncbi:MAG: hypothetical protein FJX45_18250 [Alphaproteobacteria bacterium]|nr:hypothetical protein [Alphaproteobacteria bacterium]MBM3653977.1 hypothetical protein [Alphaproteobacteria bacterium]
MTAPMRMAVSAARDGGAAVEHHRAGSGLDEEESAGEAEGVASVPVSAFAVAADAAARCLGEPLADLFDEEAPSRARMIAIDAMIEIYPGAARVEIARCFGLTCSGRDLARRRAAAQSAAWWRRADVDCAIEKIRASLGRIERADVLTGFAPIVRLGGYERAPADDEPRVSAYRPRVWRPARLLVAPARRAANPTAALMGDPDPARSALHARGEGL